ncbi:MAG TPA: DsbA family protein [Chthoniobacterales bacterium]|jgi:predicted DsbA family dithiol-disulfide isomerase
MRLLITNYLDVISSWCHWAIPAWQKVQAHYGDQIDYRWRIALMDEKGLPPTREATEWYYRRSGLLMRSPVMLSTAWLEPGRAEYLEPNCIAEAARDLGIEDDHAWMALSQAELREGKKIARWEVAAQVVAEATGLEKKKLIERAKSPEIEARLRQSTAEFHALQVTQRPTFVIDSPIGDRAVFSGFAKAEPLVSTIDAMLDDIVGYQAYAAHYGSVPS